MVSRLDFLAVRQGIDGEERWPNFKEAVNCIAKKVISYKKIHQKPRVIERSKGFQREAEKTESSG